MVTQIINNQDLLVNSVRAIFGSDQYASIVISGSVGTITGLFIFIKRTLETVSDLDTQHQVIRNAIDWTNYPNMEQYMDMFKDNVANQQRLSRLLGRPGGPAIALGAEIEDHISLNPVRRIMPNISELVLYSDANNYIVNIIKWKRFLLDYVNTIYPSEHYVLLEQIRDFMSAKANVLLALPEFPSGEVLNRVLIDFCIIHLDAYASLANYVG